MNENYREAFQRSWSSQPLRHAARVAQFQARWLAPQRLADRHALDAAVRNGASIWPTRGLLRPPPHHYQGYGGPWIEDHFFRYWLRTRPQSSLCYVPVFWTDIYQHVQTHRFTPRQHAALTAEIADLLDRRLAPDRCYFTLLELDDMIWDWYKFPRHVAVFSAGGWGDIPIPSLKGSAPFSSREKNIAVSFVGRLDGPSDSTGVRSRMHAALREHALFTAGTHWREVMARSTFSLCPRGLGRSSYRLYEALSVGSIPIYLWSECEWLPYRDEIDWSEISISLPIDRVAELPNLLRDYPPPRIAAMQRKIAALYDDYFTLDGVCRRICAQVEKLADRGAFRRLMEARSYPPGTIPTRTIPEFLFQ